MGADTVALLSAVATAVVGLCVLADILRIERMLRRSVHVTSRFPLFAARDRLVMLVAEGKISEDEPAWADAYGGFNDLLDLSFRGGLADVFHGHVRFAFRMAKDAAFRTKFHEYRSQVRHVTAKIPEFGEALNEGDQAVFEMCARRTTIWLFRWYLFAIKAGVTGAALFYQGFSASISLWRADRGDGTRGASQFIAFHHREEVLPT